MSRITHTEIMITKNPMLKVPVVVPQWEAHVLLALWGDDAQVLGTQVIDRVIPETGDEFTRLANKYGPRDEDVPFVARVYGSFGPGLRGLSKEFEASVAGSPVASFAAEEEEPLEIDRTAFKSTEDNAPAILAGFDGSKAPAGPLEIATPGVEITDAEVAAVAGIEPLIDRDAELTDEQIDAMDVDSLAGNTIKGQEVETFLESDVSDLTGGDEG